MSGGPGSKGHAASPPRPMPKPKTATEGGKARLSVRRRIHNPPQDIHVSHQENQDTSPSPSSPAVSTHSTATCVGTAATPPHEVGRPPTVGKLVRPSSAVLLAAAAAATNTTAATSIVATTVSAVASVEQSKTAEDTHTTTAATTGPGVLGGSRREEIVEECDATWFKALNDVRRSAKTRRLSSSQTDALLMMAGGLRVNLLLRGPPATGKRWIARHIARTLSLLGETVELVSKFFTVLPHGQIVIDAAALPLAWAQLDRASVIVVDDVPPQPQAAAMFFAHLDLLCRIVRCQRPPIPPKPTAPTVASGASSSGLSANPRNWGGLGSEDSPEQLPFGGLQVLATQNVSEPQPIQSQLAWHNNPNVSESAIKSGVVISSAPAPPAPGTTPPPVPHDTIKIVVFQ